MGEKWSINVNFQWLGQKVDHRGDSEFALLLEHVAHVVWLACVLLKIT